MTDEIPDLDPVLTANGAKWRQKLNEDRAVGDAVGASTAEQQLELIGLVARSRAAKRRTNQVCSR